MSVSVSAARRRSGGAGVAEPAECRAQPSGAPDDLARIRLLLLDYLAQFDQGVVGLVAVCTRRSRCDVPLYLGKKRNDLGDRHALRLCGGLPADRRVPGLFLRRSLSAGHLHSVEPLMEVSVRVEVVQRAFAKICSQKLLERLPDD
jgi:hypothetical protein